ncbi:hypothetical protein ASG54_05955 [Aureimonas sp. Leaf460]|nr:hypothetical protein ASG54_05955 [Aureimonas sp. Leaf460]
METEFVMLRTVHRFARTLALCGAFLAMPTLAGAGEGSESGFGSGAVFVGSGGRVDRGLSFGFGEGRGVAVVGGGRSSFQHYEGGRRYDVPDLGGSRYRTGNRERFYGDGVVVFDRSADGRDYRGHVRDRWESRRERFEDRRRSASDNSFIRLRDSGRIDRFERDPRYDSRRVYRDREVRGSRRLTTFDDGYWGGGSVVAYGDVDPRSIYQGTTALNRPNGPKILNVETERLDRRPIGPSGIDVTTTSAGSKIIRIAPGYRMAKADRTPRSSARNGADLGLQPWSTDWLRYCQRTHRSFDPDLGTYVTSNGRVAFCTAE